MTTYRSYRAIKMLPIIAPIFTHRRWVTRGAARPAIHNIHPRAGASVIKWGDLYITDEVLTPKYQGWKEKK